MPLHTHTTTEVHKITRTDGDVLRLTSHDRDIWFENELYTATILQASSADRREAALRAGEQELYGYLDGETILSSDLLTYAYRGARIETSVIDFVRPWLVYGQHTRWVRSITRSGSRWTASVEGRTAQLDRPNAQRFGGTWHKECPYKLGGEYCKADVSSSTHIVQVGSGPHSRSSFNTFGHPAGTLENFYRDGSVEWYAGTGTTYAAYTASDPGGITDSTASWTPGEFEGSYLMVREPTESWPNEKQLIVANSETYIAVAGFGYTPAAGGVYTIVDASDKGGTSSPIVSDDGPTNTWNLLIPVPRPIIAGEWVKVHPGCDGLITTCDSKFDNVINHGGDQYAPSGHEIIEQPEDNA